MSMLAHMTESQVPTLVLAAVAGLAAGFLLATAIFARRGTQRSR